MKKINAAVDVCDSPIDLAETAAEYFAEYARQEISAKGSFSVALAGGSTPQLLYECLASDPFKEKIDWNAVHVFWSDERYVPADHQDSNYLMARRAILENVAIPDNQIHRFQTELTPELAAEMYEDIIREKIPLSKTGIPRFDLILLGIGSDGHTASLFPNTEALKENQRLVISNRISSQQVERLTFAVTLINTASRILILAAGKGKSRIIQKLFETHLGESIFPVQLVKPLSGNIIWLLDSEAAGRIITG